MRIIQIIASLSGLLSLGNTLVVPSEAGHKNSDIIVATRDILPRAGEATLTAVSITFHTNDEDKDGDSHLTITLKDSVKTISATIDSDFVHFDDDHNYGPYNLDVFYPSTRSEVRAGTVTLRLDPKGHDTWRFNWQMTMTFSDGTRMRAQAAGVELSQDHREKTWSVVG
ncbi:hypothetical protein QBC37DRAFT_380982 [Rhypophila decipiens]|uniref:PLAT domain-containing protein n=1 Tax=Rhypophila decipiens TaxID=261697 RepID=A0AAN7AYW6_9PEZI|nr:hypothetical protein QBC37DRAFT_380982 [Rhypophila decipiens]